MASMSGLASCVSRASISASGCSKNVVSIVWSCFPANHVGCEGNARRHSNVEVVYSTPGSRLGGVGREVGATTGSGGARIAIQCSQFEVVKLNTCICMNF
jgi:hypothetical protein